MISYKIFGRMLDLVIADHSDRNSRAAERELDALQDAYGWPWKASKEQLREWNELHSRLDSDTEICDQK